MKNHNLRSKENIIKIATEYNENLIFLTVVINYIE